MACFYPLPAYVDRQGGSPRIGRRPGEEGDRLELPCGRCIGCRQERARAWSIRCMHEAQLYDSSYFVTLDYAPEHLPASLSLEYRDFQLFMKRLRKECDGASEAPDGRRAIRFFVAGEYGSRYRRPHWHALLFNLHLRDAERYHNGTYRSEQLERLWGKGHAVIGDVTPQSAAYVAGYTLGKVYGPGAEDHYEDVVNLATGEVTARRPEFVSMSRRPGIGAWWFQEYGGDLFPHDFAISSDGRKYKVPSYYWRRFQAAAAPDLVEEVAYARYQRAKETPREESSEERREVRAEVARARVRTFQERHH